MLGQTNSIYHVLQDILKSISYLATYAIKCDLAQELDFEELIVHFASVKVWEMHF